jgi:hypothetical protein
VVALRIPQREVRATSISSDVAMRATLRSRFVALLRHEARRLLIPIAVLTIISSTATAASPALRNEPLLLVALCPRMSFLAMAAPKVGLLPFLAVGLFRLCLGDPFHFFLGRRHGSAAVAKLNRWRLFRALTSIAGHSGPLLVFLRPNGTNLAIAGASGSHAMKVAVADVVGTIVYLLLVYELGSSFLHG